VVCLNDFVVESTQKIAEKQLTKWSVRATIAQYYGSMVGPIALFGLAVPVVGPAGLAKEARKTIVSGK